MTEGKEHAYIPVLKRQLADGKIDRREFLRTVTLLGLSASAAFAFADKVGAETVAPNPAPMPTGGTLRISMRVLDISSPHTFSQTYQSDVVRQVTEYLTKTGHDNITRPYLLQSWEPSEDLRTWTLHLRRGIRWHKGRDFTADDIIWNLKRVLDEETGSSVLGLMKGYMLDDVQKDGKEKTQLWDANAIEKLDSFTVRINCKAPQLAIPEHLFHYPLLMLDPEEGGLFEPGSNGMGAFELVEHEVGKRSVLKARQDYWDEGPYLDILEFIDLGDKPDAQVSALAKKEIHGANLVDVVELEALKLMPHLKMYDAVTAGTGLVRGKVTEKPFDDARVRKALRLAIDPEITLALARGTHGSPAEHHHVAPIHPEYAELPPMWINKKQNIQAARKLLVEAGYPDGVDLGKIDCVASPDWEANAAQAIVDQWKDIGVRCGINVMPVDSYWDVWNTTRLGFTAWSHRPLGIMVLGLAYRSGVPWNESSYSNAEFDRLLTEAEGELDVDKRREVMRKIERIMQEDGPIVQPLWRTLVTFMDKRVKGFQMHPTFVVFGNELAIES